jgi:putative phosphoribosyl transferase
MTAAKLPAAFDDLVRLSAGDVRVEGRLVVPAQALGVVLFAHGSGSSRHSPRNRYVAEVLHARGIGSLLVDLLTPDEDTIRENRFDIDLLSRRLGDAARGLAALPCCAGLPLGLFGASTGAASALRLAADPGLPIAAVVSRGGRPDLAGHAALRAVRAPVLLIVGGHDELVLELNREALAQLSCEKQLAVVPGATHLFEEPGTLEQAAGLAADWFEVHFRLSRPQRAP